MISRGWPMLAVSVVLLSACGGADTSVELSTPTTEVVTNTTVTPSTTAPGDGDETVLFTGTACGAPVSYVLGGDERIVVVRDPSEGLTALMLLDGELFDPEDESAWQAYAAANDTLLVLAFVRPQPATPHTVTAIYDSFFAGRGTGLLGFVEEGDGATIDIVALDLTSQTIEVDFTIPIGGLTSAYPPDFTEYDECHLGVIVGSFGGPFELVDFDEYPGPPTTSTPVPTPTAPSSTTPETTSVTTPSAPPLAYGEPIDLGVLPGGSWSRAFDINDHGVIVGFSHAGDSAGHAVWWPDPSGGPQRLDGSLDLRYEQHGAIAIRINNAGEVLVNSGPQAFVVDPLAGTSVEVTVDFGLKSPSGFPTIKALEMNERGDVVGSVEVGWPPHDPSVTGAEPFTRAFLWTKATGEAIDLGTLDGADSSNATGINDLGQVFGSSDGRPFVWDPSTGTMRELAILAGGDRAYPRYIDDRGDAIGFSEYGGSTVGSLHHTVIWDVATGDVIDLTARLTDSGRYDMSGLDLVGYARMWAFEDETRARAEGAIVVLDLATGLTSNPIPGIDPHSDVVTVNDQGQVVGTSAGHAALWNPIAG